MNHRHVFLSILVVMGLMIGSDARAASKVVADLSEDFVGVREGFNGARLTVFGVLKNKADVVVVIEGPPSHAQVRMKERAGGIWVNGAPRIIGPVPSFYAVVSSRPIEKIADKALSQQYGLEPTHLHFGATTHGLGLVEAKEAKKLYQFASEGVKILESNLFRADIFLPANVPIGAFKAHIYEFVGKKLIASRTEELTVAQVGFNDTLSRMAREKPLMYALLCLAMAITIGSGAAYMFRRT